LDNPQQVDHLTWHPWHHPPQHWISQIGTLDLLTQMLSLDGAQTGFQGRKVV
jgi:hypothetical protein